MSRRFLSDVHFSLLAVILFLCIVGIFNLYSATYQGGGQLYLTQVYWMLTGLVLMILLLFVDYRILERFAYPILVISIVALIAVLAVGPKIYGARRWLPLGFTRFQPSELMKVTLIVTLAKYFHDDHTVGGYSFTKLIKPLLLAGIPVLLVAAEPDLGTALLLCFISFSIFLFVKIKWQTVLMIALVGALSVPLAYRFVLKDYQRDRVKTFLNPSRDPKGRGYHSIQSIIAVGSGKFYGKGHLKGSQTQLAFLPEQHTDFIFSVFAEEHGFTGVVIFLFVYIAFLFFGLDVSRSARDKFGAILALGITAMFFWHAFVNIGMVIGVMPVVGVTLPFMSYGGSSLLVSMISVGLLLSIYSRRFIF